jgi:hypothetical protein
VQQVAKEKREAGVRGPIIGNATVPFEGMTQTEPPAKATKPTEPDAADTLEEDSIPF